MSIGVEVTVMVASRPLCISCNKNWARKYKKADGSIGYKKHCTTCGEDPKKRLARENREYTLAKKTYCEQCGFVAENACQLDVDHIDGDHENNDPLNLQTLCANCHRLKTFNESNSVNVRYRENDQ